MGKMMLFSSGIAGACDHQLTPQAWIDMLIGTGDPMFGSWWPATIEQGLSLLYPNATTKQHMYKLGALTTGLPIAASSQVPAGPGSSTRPGCLL